MMKKLIVCGISMIDLYVLLYQKMTVLIKCIHHSLCDDALLCMLWCRIWISMFILFTVENIEALQHFLAPWPDISYFLWRFTMSSFRISGPLGSYCLSLGHGGYAAWLHMFHSHSGLLRSHTPVIDVLIDSFIDWSILRDSVILLCDLIIHDHSLNWLKTCSMNNLMIAEDPMQTTDLETFL